MKENEAIAFYNRALAYENKEKYDLAIADYDQAIRLNPDFIFARKNRAYAYEAKNEYSRAIPDFDHILRLQPTDAEVLNSRCWARALVEELNAALIDCNESLRPVSSTRRLPTTTWRSSLIRSLRGHSMDAA